MLVGKNKGQVLQKLVYNPLLFPLIHYIEKYFSEDLNFFKKKNKIKINLMINEGLGLQDYILEFKSKSGKILEKVEKNEILQKVIEPKVEKNLDLTNDKKSNFKRKKFKKRKNLKKN